MTHLKELSQIQFGPITFEGPVKVRINWKLLPDFTIDVSRAGIMSILKPKATILVGQNAFTIDPWGTEKVAGADPTMFNKDTWFDSFAQIGVLPTLIVLGTLTFAIYTFISRRM